MLASLNSLYWDGGIRTCNGLANCHYNDHLEICAEFIHFFSFQVINDKTPWHRLSQNMENGQNPYTDHHFTKYLSPTHLIKKQSFIEFLLKTLHTIFSSNNSNTQKKTLLLF